MDTITKLFDSDGSEIGEWRVKKASPKNISLSISVGEDWFNFDIDEDSTGESTEVVRTLAATERFSPGRRCATVQQEKRRRRTEETKIDAQFQSDAVR